MSSTNGRRIARSMIGSAIVGIVVFVLLLSLAPDAVPFSQNNYGWNGMQQVDSSHSIKPITSLADAQPKPHNVMLVIAPTTHFSEADAKLARNFADLGGTLIIADSSGVANTLLANMGIGVSIREDSVVKDPIYNWKSPDIPIALVPSGASEQFHSLSNVRALALNSPMALNISSYSSPSSSSLSPATIVGLSSPYSEIYSVSNSTSSLSSVGAATKIGSGSTPLVAMEAMGLGLVVVVGDSTFFTNSVWKNANNQIFVNNLLSNSTVYLDTSHWPSNIGESLKAQFLNIYSTLGQSPYRYLFAVGAVGVSIMILPVFSGAIEATPRRRQRQSEIRRTQGDGESTYNEKILNRVRKDREGYHHRGGGVQQSE